MFAIAAVQMLLFKVYTLTKVTKDFIASWFCCFPGLAVVVSLILLG